MYAIGPSGKGFRGINSEADLLPGETFSTTLPVISPDLIGYANDKQWKLATGGFTISFVSGPTVEFGTDGVGLALLNGAVARQSAANPPATVMWQTMPSTFVPLSGARIVAAGTKIADFIAASFAALQAVTSAIAAGTITTTAQVDAYAWPSNTTAA